MVFFLVADSNRSRTIPAQAGTTNGSYAPFVVPSSGGKRGSKTCSQRKISRTALVDFFLVADSKRSRTIPAQESVQLMVVGFAKNSLFNRGTLAFDVKVGRFRLPPLVAFGLTLNENLACGKFYKPDALSGRVGSITTSSRLEK